MTRNQIEYWRLVETNRNNLAVERETNRSNLANEKERNRSNLAQERETNRHNLAVEQETNRHNVATEKETQRSNLARETLTRMQMQQNLFLTRIDQEERARSNRKNEQLTSLQIANQHERNLNDAMFQKAQIRIQEINAVTARANAMETQRSNRARETLTASAQAETNRSNLANESINLARANEVARSNRSNEAISRYRNQIEQFKAQETKRSNLARETEQHRSNVARERIDVLKLVVPIVTNNTDAIASGVRSARFTLAKLAVRAGGM